ncbi:MAG TPA: hypothetical protein VFA05_07025 [Gaiellaceae bacterium]|nr:hypothetical protein [Gaiellaceae bacterium]
MTRAQLDGWSSAHERGEDGAIESAERIRASRAVVPASPDGARLLGERYWLAVRRATFGLVRLGATPHGSALRIAGAPLLRFGRAELAADANGVRCRFPITGGMLARRSGGVLVLSQSKEGELCAALTGFVPRLATGTYERIQRRIHVAISRRFFHSLLGE